MGIKLHTDWHYYKLKGPPLGLAWSHHMALRPPLGLAWCLNWVEQHWPQFSQKNGLKVFGFQMLSMVVEFRGALNARWRVTSIIFVWQNLRIDKLKNKWAFENQTPLFICLHNYFFPFLCKIIWKNKLIKCSGIFLIYRYLCTHILPFMFIHEYKWFVHKIAQLAFFLWFP